MLSIKGIYTLPALKYVFFVISSFDECCDFFKEEEQIDKRRKYLERIIRLKNCDNVTINKKWTLQVISESDLLSVIKHKQGGVSSIQSSHFPDHLELLAMNLLKPSKSSDSPFYTPKVLSRVPDEDIIEVFI